MSEEMKEITAQELNGEDLIEVLVKEYGEEVKEINEKYSKDGYTVYGYIFDDNEKLFLFRNLKTREYRKLKREAKDDDDMENKILMTGIVYPKLKSVEEIEELNAGEVEILLNFIALASGFNSQSPVFKL